MFNGITVNGHVAATGDHQVCGIFGQAHLAHPCRIANQNLWPRGQLLPQRRTDMSIGDDIAQRIDPLLSCAEPRTAQTALIGHLNLAHRAGVRCKMWPDAERFENSSAAVAKRRGALIETGLIVGFSRDRLDQRHAFIGMAQRQRQAGADHTAADDEHIDCGRRKLAHSAALLMQRP